MNNETTKILEEFSDDVDGVCKEIINLREEKENLENKIIEFRKENDDLQEEIDTHDCSN